MANNNDLVNKIVGIAMAAWLLYWAFDSRCFSIIRGEWFCDVEKFAISGVLPVVILWVFFYLWGIPK